MYYSREYYNKKKIRKRSAVIESQEKLKQKKFLKFF